MIPPEQVAEIRRLFFAEHWRGGAAPPPPRVPLPPVPRGAAPALPAAPGPPPVRDGAAAGLPRLGRPAPSPRPHPAAAAGGGGLLAGEPPVRRAGPRRLGGPR